MDISVFRIDDRLIHGQIVTAWISAANAKQIVVADDKAANDELQKTLLKMATPNSIQLQIVDMNQAKALIDNKEDTKRTLFLVRGPKEALDLVDSGLNVNIINIGNLNMKKGKTKVLGNMWVDSEDVKYLRELNNRKVKLEVKVVPSDQGQDAIELLNKNNLY